MAGYRNRLEQDLDRWIAEGLVPAASREPILAQTRRAQGLDASTGLAAVGGLLLGAAVIAFVAAHWGEIPRLGRFVLILGLFAGVSGAAAWAGERKPLARNLILLVAALTYAAAIGLTGQIFDIAGDPRTALHAAGLAAAMLALAGRSSTAAMAAVALIGFGDFAGLDDHGAPWLLIAAPGGLVLAWRWGSRPLAHAAALAMPFALGLILGWVEVKHPFWVLMLFAGLFAAAAAWLRRAPQNTVGSVVQGWAVISALAFVALAGLETHPFLPVVQRVLWLASASGVIALGLHDRRPVITAAGVVAFAGAVAVIIFDLGLGLMTAAGVFAAVALLALTGGWAVRRRRGL